MTTTPTKLPVPSEKPQDLKFNAGKIDEFVTSMAQQYIDRFGQAHYTIEGLRWVAQQAITAFGYITMDSFEDGSTLTLPNQVLRLEATGEYYRWDGTFPKNVPVGSTPDSTGGQGIGAWVSVGDASLRSNLYNADGFKLIGQVSSFAALRGIMPDSAGQRILLAGWNTNSSFGGGEFIARQGDKSDDGGVIARVSSAWYWERLALPEHLTIMDFGALPDSVTDCTPSMLAMHNYSQANYPNLGIRFPSGTFRMLTNIDISSTYISRFKLSGPEVKFGYFPTATLLLGQGSGVAIKVQARWTEICNIVINGETNISANARAFFQNTVTAGQYVRVSNINATRMGGKSFSLLDTLDTKFDQFYASYCSASFLYATWSGATSGSWDHTTAIELSNFNIQYCTVENAIDCVRATQSLIRNGWIEHTEYPGNFSEGQWIFDVLSLEDCKNPLYAQYCHLIEKQTNLQSGSVIDYNSGATSDSRPSWVDSAYETGRVKIQNNGVLFDCGTANQFNYSQYRIANISNTGAWYKVGTIFMPSVGTTAIVRVLGTRGFDSAITSNISPANTDYGGGETIISIQNKSSTTKILASWKGIDSTPVIAVKYVPKYNNTVDLYVQLGAYVQEAGIFVGTSNASRIEKGVHFYFTPALTVVSDITSVTGAIDATAEFSINNGKNGFGMNLDLGNLMYNGEFASNKIPIYINGTKYFISVSTS